MQLQSLFLAQPKLFELMVQVMAFAPRLANTWPGGQPPSALLDGAFFANLDSRKTAA